MEKILGLVLVMVYGLWYLTAQGSVPTQKSSIESPTMTQESVATVEEDVTHSELSQEKTLEVVKKAGEESGWIVTDFKSNAVIAEKINEKESLSVTVTLRESSYELSPANAELEKALDSALNI